MITEWIESLTTKAYPNARRLGLVAESIAIAARYKRQKKHWQPHLDQTQSIIHQAIDDSAALHPIIILGAGYGFDLPIEMLINYGQDIYFIDVVQSKRLKKLTRQHKHLHHLLYDVTGRISPTDHQKNFLPNHILEQSMMISCNLLSQLFLPFAHVPPENSLDAAIIHEITKDHLIFLKQAKKSIVISDFKKIITFTNGKQQITDTLEHSLLGKPKYSWDWDLCPLGEQSRKYTVQLNVGVWYF